MVSFCAIGSIPKDDMILLFPLVTIVNKHFSSICANKTHVSFKHFADFQEIQNALTHIILLILAASSRRGSIIFTLYLNVGSDMQCFLIVSLVTILLNNFFNLSHDAGPLTAFNIFIKSS